MFQVFHVRKGFACNSSSTHSIIYLPAGTEVEDLPPAESSFGWDPWQCSTSSSKKNYLATMFYGWYKEYVGEDVAALIAKSWIGSFDPKNGYVDHQSTFAFPFNWDGKSPDQCFVKALKKFLLNKRVVIVGGNDNDDLSAPAAYIPQGIDVGINWLPVESNTQWISKYDPIYKFWTFFSRKDGTKLRFHISSKPKDIPQRASTPELVDIKITDYCPFNCDYCYQGSTPKGQHADIQAISDIAYILQRLQVFEVALGGGEPTMHPKFLEILDTFSRNNIVSNFTTKSLDWLSPAKKPERILEKIGAFAYSIENHQALEKFIEQAKTVLQVNTDKVSVQYIVGLSDDVLDFEKILNTCAQQNIRLTLLGAKYTGRGQTFGFTPNTKWLDVVVTVMNNKYYNKLCIDTVLAHDYYDTLIAKGVPTWCLTVKEGKFSCYIDAVAQTIAPCSYSLNQDHKPIKGLFANDIGQIFMSF